VPCYTFETILKDISEFWPPSNYDEINIIPVLALLTHTFIVYTYIFLIYKYNTFYILKIKRQYKYKKNK
jgi:hypothetical protein